MKQIVDSSKFIVLLLTIALFSMSYLYPISVIIINTLNFLILMEAVRTVYEYVCNPQHRTKVRYVIDGGIFFGMKELYVGWLMMKTNLELGVIIMLMSLLGIGALIVFRRRSMVESPDVLDVNFNKGD